MEHNSNKRRSGSDSLKPTGAGPDKSSEKNDQKLIPVPPVVQAWLDEHDLCLMPKGQVQAPSNTKAAPKVDKAAQPLPAVRSPIKPPVQLESPTRSFGPFGSQPLVKPSDDIVQRGVGSNKQKSEAGNAGSKAFHSLDKLLNTLKKEPSKVGNKDRARPSADRDPLNARLGSGSGSGSGNIGSGGGSSSGSGNIGRLEQHAKQPSQQLLQQRPQQPAQQPAQQRPQQLLQQPAQQRPQQPAQQPTEDVAHANPQALSSQPGPMPASDVPKSHSRTPFTPMNAIMYPQYGLHRAGRAMEMMSPEYQPDYRNETGGVPGLDPRDNCALWVTGLPPDISYTELLAAIRSVGRIWCTVIKPADYRQHSEGAAKVVFFTPEAAHRLLAEGVKVRGVYAHLGMNRIMHAPQLDLGDASRVLIVTGHPSLVNERALTDFFEKRFLFDVDEVATLMAAKERAVVEYRFGSYRCQAQMGKMALERDEPEGFEMAEFGEDPCEVGDSMASFGIAGERMQGKWM